MVDEKYDESKVKKNRQNNINLFEMFNESGIATLMVDMLSQHFERISENIHNIKIRGKKFSKFSGKEKNYRKALTSLFSNSRIINPNRLFRMYGLDKKQILHDFNEKPDTQKVINYVLKKSKGFNYDKFEDELIIGGKRSHRVSQTIGVVIKVFDKIKDEKDEQIKRFTLFYLYLTLFESIIILFEPIYKRLTGKKKLNVRHFLDVFSKKNKILTANLDYDLRNDFSHLLFEHRMGYSNKKLEEMVQNLILENLVFLDQISKEIMNMCNDFISKADKLDNIVSKFQS